MSDVPVNEQLRDRVRDERNRRNLSMSEAARLGDVSPGTWTSFESTANLTLRMRSAVAKAFGWPSDWHTRPEAPARPADAPADETLAQILRRLDQLTGTDVAAVDREWLLQILERLDAAEQRLAQLEAAQTPAAARNEQFATAAEGGDPGKRQRGGRRTNRPHPPAEADPV